MQNKLVGCDIKQKAVIRKGCLTILLSSQCRPRHMVAYHILSMCAVRSDRGNGDGSTTSSLRNDCEEVRDVYDEDVHYGYVYVPLPLFCLVGRCRG